MKNICMTIRILTVMLLFSFNASFAQELIPIKVLSKDYPLLMEKFGNELKTQRANYLFAIDVSGTMRQYANIVIPAMSQFVESLEEGDNVNIIRFGTKAKVSLGGFSDITKETKISLKQYIQNLYEKDPELFSYTDLNCLLKEINKQLQIQKNNLTFIFILTDFVDDPAPEKEKLNVLLCEKYNKSLEARGVDVSMYMYALQLPVSVSNHLDLFKSAIPGCFNFETFSITSSQALKNWFDRKKTEIMLDRFRAIINRKQTALQLSAASEITVDGDVCQSIYWKPNELYKTLSLDSIQLDSVSRKNGWELKTGSNIPFISEKNQDEINVGLIKSESWGFHKLNGKLQTTFSLPTLYDRELKKLEIDKQKLSVTQNIDKIIFSFCFPLWLTIVTIIILLIYFIAVVRAFFRNRSCRWRINGKIIVEYRGIQIQEYEIYNDKKVGVGCDGMPVAIYGYDCDWQLTIYQKTFSCFKCWKKPVYKVKLEKGSTFETANGIFMLHDITSISKGEYISINGFDIIWTD